VITDYTPAAKSTPFRESPIRSDIGSTAREIDARSRIADSDLTSLHRDRRRCNDPVLYRKLSSGVVVVKSAKGWRVI